MHLYNKETLSLLNSFFKQGSIVSEEAINQSIELGIPHSKRSGRRAQE